MNRTSKAAASRLSKSVSILGESDKKSSVHPWDRGRPRIHHALTHVVANLHGETVSTIPIRNTDDIDLTNAVNISGSAYPG